MIAEKVTNCFTLYIIFVFQYTVRDNGYENKSGKYD